MIERPLCSPERDHASSHGIVKFAFLGTCFGTALVLLINFVLLVFTERLQRKNRAKTPSELPDVAEVQARIEKEDKEVAEEMRVNRYTIFLANAWGPVEFFLGSDVSPSEVLDSIFESESKSSTHSARM